MNRQEQNTLFLGDAGVGKTSIINRFLGLGFNEIYAPTYGNQVRPGFVDSSGQEKFGFDESTISQEVDCVAIVFDLTSRLSFKNLRFWISLATRKFPTSQIRILGNKSDCLRKVKQTEIDRFCARNGYRYNEVSARTDRM